MVSLAISSGIFDKRFKIDIRFSSAINSDFLHKTLKPNYYFFFAVKHVHLHFRYIGCMSDDNSLLQHQNKGMSVSTIYGAVMMKNRK